MSWVRDPRTFYQQCRIWQLDRVLILATGHVIGLMHEHQRPDAPRYVRFDCTALHGYDVAERRVAAMQAGEPAFTPGMSTHDKMALVLVKI